MTQKEMKPVLWKEKLNLSQKQSLIIISLHRPKRSTPLIFPFITFLNGVNGVVAQLLLSQKRQGHLSPDPQLEFLRCPGCPLHPTRKSPAPRLQISQILPDPVNSEARCLYGRNCSSRVTCPSTGGQGIANSRNPGNSVRCRANRYLESSRFCQNYYLRI